MKIEINNKVYHITRNHITVTEYGETVFELVLSESNRKIGKITNFSIMPGETCAAWCQDTCGTKCYDKNSVRMYPSVKAARETNTAAVKNHMDDVETALSLYIDTYAPEYFRIHVGGDFFAVEYFEMWLRIAASFTKTHFLAYTKQYDVVRYVLINQHQTVPENMALFVSIWRGIAEPWDLMKILPVAALTTDTSAKKDSTICPGSCTNCKLCYERKNVVFIPHGNGITAKMHAALETAARILFKSYVPA